MNCVTQNETSASRTEIKNSSSRFPKGLHRIESAPKQLFVIGDTNNLDRPAIAIVGARKATPYGLNCASHFAHLAAAHGIVVVSGGAIGCDQAAHKGALGVGGRTVVVLGCGADVVYPARAKKLFEQVLAEDGTIVSEAPWGAQPTRWGFKKRNRIIAGLAQATLIVEAGLPSGTFSTADATLLQGKEVLAIPGSIFAKESKGANQLIAQGAIPIIDDDSFCDALRQVFGSSRVGAQLTDSSGNMQDRCNSGDARQQKILATLAQSPQNIESLLGIAGNDVTEVIRCLSAMEFAGVVLRLRDGRYSMAAGNTT